MSLSLKIVSCVGRSGVLASTSSRSFVGERDYTTKLAVLSLSKRVKDPYHLFLDEFKASSDVNRLKASGNNKWFMEAKKAGFEKWNAIDAATKQRFENAAQKLIEERRRGLSELSAAEHAELVIASKVKDSDFLTLPLSVVKALRVKLDMPKKPQVSELALFTEELLKKAPTGSAQASLDLKKKAAEEWERMDPANKERYTAERMRLLADYNKAMQDWKVNMSANGYHHLLKVLVPVEVKKRKAVKTSAKKRVVKNVAKKTIAKV